MENHLVIEKKKETRGRKKKGYWDTHVKPEKKITIKDIYNMVVDLNTKISEFMNRIPVKVELEQSNTDFIPDNSIETRIVQAIEKNRRTHLSALGGLLVDNNIPLQENLTIILQKLYEEGRIKVENNYIWVEDEK